MPRVLVEANNTRSNSPPARLPAGATQPWGAWSCALFLEHTSFEQAHQMLKAFKRVKFCCLFGCQCAFSILLEEDVQPILLQGGEPKSQHPLQIRTIGQKIEQFVVHRMSIEGCHHTLPHNGGYKPSMRHYPMMDVMCNTCALQAHYSGLPSKNCSDHDLYSHSIATDCYSVCSLML